MGNDKKVRFFLCVCGGEGAGGWDAGRESRVFLTGVGIHPLFLEQIKNVIQEGSRGAGVA